MSQPAESTASPATPASATPTSSSWHDGVGRLGVDWWATIVAGAIAVLAVAGLLPKIPW